MRVLIACEFSGTVRDAFIAAGHDAMSCDLLDTEKPGPHYKGDVRDVLGDGWDMMIAFPPCTYLCVSGMHWTRRGLRDPKLTDDAIAFVRLLLGAPIAKIALENPVGVISTQIRKPDQIIQPFMFGHPESKKTCLWLNGLPPLIATKPLQVPPSGRWSNQTPSGQNKLGPGENRWKERSKTYQGVADAMSQQWSGSALDSRTSAMLATAAASRGVQLAMNITQTANVLGRTMQRSADMNCEKSEAFSTRFVELEPDLWVVARALAGR